MSLLLDETNPDFSDGKELFSEGKYAEARARFEAALPDVRQYGGESRIRFAIALSMWNEGDLLGSIEVFKSVAANDTYSSITRAHAARSLGELSVNPDPAVRAAIFSAEPYASFLTESPGVSARRIYEYASALYPTALSELRVAAWHANVLEVGVRSNEEKEESRLIVEEKLMSAERDMARITPGTFEAMTIPTILRTRAIVLGRMANAGYGSFDDADTAFKVALDSASGNTLDDARARYWYSVFLANSDMVDQAIAMLTQVIADTTAENILANLVNPRYSTDGEAEALRQMASDPAVAAFLTEHGWISADF